MHGYGFTAAPLSAPGGALRQWRHDDGTEGWALIFEPPWDNHSLLQDGVGEIRDYLSSLGPGPLLKLSAFSAATLYYASAGVPLSTLIGTAHGERAALEFLGRAAHALLSLDRGTLPSHGDLSPWRILIDGNGQVSILGLGVPAVPALAWLDEEVDTVEVDALRFFPPERLEDRGEDGRSDAYALGLCAAELALGVPVLSGSLDALLDTIYEGKVADQIERLGDDLSDDGLGLICATVEHKISQRPTLQTIATDALALAKSAKGPSLASLVATPMRVVPLPTPATVADTLLAAAPNAPQPVDNRPVLAPQLTRQQTDEAPPALPSPVPILSESASLAQVQAHGLALTHRADALSKQAADHAAAVQSAPGVTDALIARAMEAAGRARKAAATARRSLTLLELDDDAMGAQITLDLVSRAEQQAQKSTLQAQEILADVDRQARAQRVAAQALHGVIQRSQDAAQRASAAAETAMTHAEALEVSVESGALGAPAVRDLLALAWSLSESAHNAAKEADTAVDRTREADDLRSAEAGASAALSSAEMARELSDEVSTLVETAAAVERQAITEYIDQTPQYAADASADLERARAAAHTATETARQLPAQTQISRAQRQAVQATKLVESAAKGAKSAMEAANSSTNLVTAQAAVDRAEQFAKAAKSQAATAQYATDSVLKTAGAAAQAAAELDALRGEARVLASSVRRAAIRAQHQLEGLTAALVDIRGPAPRAHHGEVDAATQRLLAAANSLETSANTLAADNPVADFATLESAITEALLDVDVVNRRTLLAEQAAEGELAALHAQEARQAALNSAVTAAALSAQDCRTRANAAQKHCAVQATELRATGLPKVLELLSAAEEIIDIALFQAGEAETSAKWAADEVDVDDATAHASTAASFAERIRQDLPEAVEVLKEAQELAHAQLAELNARRSAAASAHQQGVAAHKAMTAAFSACLAVSKRRENGIQRACALLSELQPQADEQHRKLQDINHRVQHSTDVKTAQAGVDSALHLAHSLLALKSQADDRHDAMRRAIVAADAQVDALLAAVERSNQWQKQATESNETIQEQHRLLAHSIVEYSATSDEVEVHRTALADARESAKGHAKRVLTAAQGVQGANTSEAADTHLADLRSALESLDDCRDHAIDAANAGVAAAERESQERRRADVRARDEASQRAAEHLVQLTALVERSVSAREEAASALQGAVTPTSRVHRRHADRHHERLLAAVQAALSSADEAANAPDARSAEDANLRAARAAELGISAAKAAEEALRQVLDHHRFAAEAAQALAGMQSEAASLTKVAADLIGKARDEARLILKLDVDIRRKKALAGEAGDHVKTAERAAAKLTATTAMMAEETAPDEAQGLLKICRAIVQRIEQKVELIRGLVNSAREQAAAEAAEAAKALTDARAKADAPLEQSIRAAAQAASLLESAQRDLPSDPASLVVDAFEELKAAVERCTACAEDARIERTENHSLDNVDTLTGRADELTSIATESDDLLAEVVQAVEALAAATHNADQLHIRLTAAHESEQAQVRQIRDAALQVNAVHDELAAWLGAVAQPGAPAQAALEEVNQHAAAAEKAALDSAALTEDIATSESESNARAAALTNHFNEVIEHLGTVVSSDERCRQAVADEALRRTKAQEELEAKRREEAAQQRANEAKAHQAQASDASTDRSQRLGSRRRRFLERRGRAPEGAPTDPLDTPGDDEPRARKWVRQEKGSATEASVKAKGRPRPAQRPSASAPSTKPPGGQESATGADALLQRLRDRANKD